MKFTTFKYLLLIISTITISGCTLLRSVNPFKKRKPLQVVVVPPPVAKPGELKKFSELITPAAKQDSGLFTVYKQEGRYYFEIPDSLIGRDILMVSRITRSAAENRNPQVMLGYGGDEINENVVRWDKGPDNHLFLRNISYGERGGDSTQVMYRSVMNSSIQPIVASFDIRSTSKRKNGVIIDMTDQLNGDNDLLFFDNGKKAALRLVAYQPDKSYIREVKSYPGNVEIKTVKTYLKASQVPNLPPSDYATYELNNSWVLLPKRLMKTRAADSRVGYFSQNYTDYNANPQGIERESLITRWRLEPKAEDVKRYLAGELVEPKKQIVFYIDPATPKKWVPFLIQGVNDWQKAFEQAGFKNAIIAKEAPVADTTWSLEDASHNAIIYKPSDIPNASGPNVHDPRTGEIIETHVNWYHNVMSLLHSWYMIQAGAVDPQARKMHFDDQLMGQLIRFVSSHEIGHTLGLLHNFGASSTVSVDSLRNKVWVEAHGHTPSIMDYARFNYVAQPEDHIGQAGIFPRIGEYDRWAIEYGYRWFAPESDNKEKASLNRWVIERTGKNKHLWFGSEADNDDPRDQSEDIGDNAMTASNYGIKNLQRIMLQLPAWTKVPDEGYEHLTELYSELLGQYSRYMGHVVKNIGGIYTNPKSVEQKGPVVQYVSREKQQEAMVFLQHQLFNTPVWLLSPTIFEKTGSGSIATIGRQQEAVLSKLFDPNLLYKLLQAEGHNGSSAYTVSNLLGELQGGIFSELQKGNAISIYRRNLQKMYLEKIFLLIKPVKYPFGYPGSGAPDISLTDIPSIATAKLKLLDTQLKHAARIINDPVSKAHLEDMDKRIINFLKNTDTNTPA